MEQHKEDTNKYPLTKTEAEFRKNELLSSNNEYKIDYNLIITLRKSTDAYLNQETKAKDFEGRIKITFDYFPKTNDDLFLNYHGLVNSVSCNGKQTEINYQKRRIFLKKSDLNVNEKNEVVILFSSIYGHSGTGLHQFVDPSDKKEYLYTQFEPFECNTVFPVFDQPDLKATLSIALCGSKEWVLLSNENDVYTNENIRNLKDLGALSASERENLSSHFPEFAHLSESEFDYLFGAVLDKDYKISAFLKTEKISSYLFAVCAGPFYCHKDPFNYKVPLRIYMRESLKDCGDPREFFRITIAGMEWYKEFFGYAYPFRKYDQIYCPEYNYGAMENVGLVTYTEVYCWKENPTNQLKNRFSITVLHELAHMWFGNFVTMKWWDDLWLNESFATFISFLCQDQALKGSGQVYEYSWPTFNSYKGLAYKEDQNSTTHSVYSDISDTEMAHSNFDAIVYYKGSSLLKQMFYFIGEKNFSKGLNQYFTKYMWSNTVFDNFVDEMVSAVKNSEDTGDSLRKQFDLKTLSKKWLTESGLNQVELVMETSGEEGSKTIKNFLIKQTPALEKHANLQTHLMDALFVYENENKIIKDVIVNNTEMTQVPQVLGMPAPRAVILNYNDYAYLKWLIDDTSFEYLKANLHSKNLDLLTRKLVYRAIYDGVRDAKIASSDYIDTISAQLQNEPDEELIVNNLGYLAAAISNFLPWKYYKTLSAVLYEMVAKLLKKFISQKTLVISLLPYLISFANLPQLALPLKNWLLDEPFITVESEKLMIPKELVSQDNRFAVLQKLFMLTELSTEEKMKLLEAEKSRDKFSDKSIKTELTCKALLPEAANKQAIWDKIIKEPKSDSLHNMRSLMAGFAPLAQLDLVEKIIKDRFFVDVLELSKNEYFFIDYFFVYCTPVNFVEKDVIDQMEKLISELNTSEHEYIKKKLLEMADDMKRYLKAQTLCELKMSILNKWDHLSKF